MSLTFRPFSYGHGQFMYYNPNDRKKNQNKKFYSHLIKRKYFNVVKNKDGWLSERGSYRSRFKNSYQYYPHFLPGQKVFILLCNNGYGVKIAEDVIEEVMCFGRGGKYRKDYWLKHHGNGHGIDAEDIFATYNEAKAAMFWF